MKTSVLRRYAPLAALLVVQLVIIATVPSRGSGGDDEFVASGGVPGAEGYQDPSAAGGTGGGTGETLDPTTGDTVATGATGGDAGGDTGGDPAAGGGDPAAGGGGGTGGGDAGGGGGDAGGGGGPAPAAGDTKHCAGDRQFDTKVIYYAPPCVPKWTGGDNGGGTYMGVTDTEIKVVVFESQPDPAVDTLLKSVDLGSNASERAAFRAAAEKFINERYELYGRKLVFDLYTGTCDTLPPDYACFRNDMRTLVRDKKPFAVIWNTPLASAAFDELSKLRVINIGGHHFDDGFSVARRPYHYDWRMSGTQLAKFLSEYWCKRLAGGKAEFAQDPLMQQQTRVLGVITPDDPANQRVLQEFQAMVKGCGGGVKATYSYQQDIDRANEQRKAGLKRMRDAGVNTLMCICDGIAPYFMVITQNEDAYFPENIVPGSGGMDFDPVGRLYSVGTGWENAFGVSTLPVLEPYANNEAARVWKAAGNSGNPPYNLALNDWSYHSLVAGALQMAGPNLNPGTFEQGAFRSGRPSDNPLHDARSFGPGDYTQVDDIKVVTWSRTARSNLDGRPGAYIPQDGGKRYQQGQQPKKPATR